MKEIFSKLIYTFLIYFIFLNQIHAEENKQVIKRIGFGSCLEQWNPQEIWKPMIYSKPELFLWLGDNIYYDSYIADEKKYYYNLLTSRKEFQDLKKISRMLYTWDDHDYGINDSGSEYEDKVNSQRIFLEAFEENPSSPRWKRKGIYDSYYFGTKGKRLQVIMLDTRYFRSELKRDWRKYFGIKRNIPNTDEGATVLGEAQWKWFSDELEKEADLRVIVSSIQLVNTFHPFEKWGNFPSDRKKFFDLIKEKKARRVIVLSGDRHMSELNVERENIPYPIYDFTSSSFNKPFKFIAPEESPKRVGKAIVEENFGTMDIYWEDKEPYLELRIISLGGKEEFYHKVKFKEIE
jgi:alkaline phosphatase D